MIVMSRAASAMATTSISAASMAADASARSALKSGRCRSGFLFWPPSWLRLRGVSFGTAPEPQFPNDDGRDPRHVSIQESPAPPRNRAIAFSPIGVAVACRTSIVSCLRPGAHFGWAYVATRIRCSRTLSPRGRAPHRLAMASTSSGAASPRWNTRPAPRNPRGGARPVLSRWSLLGRSRPLPHSPGYRVGFAYVRGPGDATRVVENIVHLRRTGWHRGHGGQV